MASLAACGPEATDRPVAAESRTPWTSVPGLGATDTDAPATTPSTAPRPTAGPVPCYDRATFSCFPKATISSVAKVLAGKGGSCGKSKDTGATICVKGAQQERITVTLEPDLTQPSDRLASFDAMTSSRTAGDNPKGRALVIANLKGSLPTLLRALLPTEPATQQHIGTWLQRSVEKCPGQPVRMDGYQVSCDAPQRFQLRDDDGKVYSSWTFGLSVGGGTTYK